MDFPHLTQLRRLTLPTLVALAFATASRVLTAQARPDSVSGRVTTDSGAVIAGADVIVTIAPSTNTVRQTTDSAGRYAMAIPEGTGEYILYIGAAGRKPFRTRLTRIGRDSTFTVDAKLASAITAVAAVKVQARKPRPSASLAGESGFGTSGNDKSVDGVNGALPPDLANNVDAMASLIPGLAVGPGGISAFGMSSDANSTTLNGLSFGGGDLPRDARTQTRFTTSPWDPTLGGAAGVLVRQILSPGANISSRSAHLTFDDPALQFSDPIAAHIGQEYSNIQLSEGGIGAYALDALFYNYGIQVSRRTSAVASAGDLDAAALSLSGVSRDSAARLIQTLGTLRVPVSAGVAPRLVTNSVSFTERVDHRLPTVPFGSTPLPAWSLTAVGSYSGSDPASLSTSALSTFAGTSSNVAGTLQGEYTRYFGKDGGYLNEITSALSYNEARGSPYFELPGGNVLIASQLPDGTTGLGALTFGGNSALARDAKTWSWELINQTDFLGGGLAALPMKVFLQSRFDGFSQSNPANRLGMFGFPSLDALATNAPSTFSRTLNAPDASGHEWTGAAALGGTYTKDKLVLTGGARVEGNVFLNAPAENSQVETLFGARTDHLPNTVAFLPRLGFTYHINGQNGNSMSVSQLSRIFEGPSQIRGGIGEFRGTARPTLIAGALTSTGLPGGVRRLLCTGSATPTPDWSAYAADSAAIPASCLNSSALADTAPSVTLFDRSWNVGNSWRATLGYSKTLLATYFSIDANYSLNLHQPGTYDLNFGGTPQFTMAGEGGRPVYVSPSSIDPSSGAISSVQSRVSPAFGRVVDQRSDLRSEARQLTVYAIPGLPFRFGLVTLGYTYADARAQSRGFDFSTAGDPRLVDWSPGLFTPRHTFQLGIARPLGKWGGITTLFRAQSGLPFTPLVGGDINGDGLSNDRAFVFNPATAADAALATDMRALMASGPATGRSCLAKQVGQVAALNSCTGPWSATMNASVYAYNALPWTGGRARASLSFQNVLGGLDELIHGDNHLQGWGMSPFPDQTLLRVRGFDPASNSFLYSVNPRFGSTSISTTSQRVPFRITLDISVDVGHSGQEQALDQNLRIRPALVGTHAPMDSVKIRYMNRDYSDFYGFLLVRMKDSLALTLDQQRQMQDERDRLRQKADSIYTVLATYLVSLPNSYDRKEAVKRVNDAGDAVWTAIDAEGPFLTKLLTPGQVRLLPQPIFNMIISPNIHSRFFFGF